MDLNAQELRRASWSWARRRAASTVAEPLEPVTTTTGVIYLGPRDQHIVFEGGHVMAVRSAKQHFTRPAVDPLFASAAEVYERCVRITWTPRCRSRS